MRRQWKVSWLLLLVSNATSYPILTSHCDWLKTVWTAVSLVSITFFISVVIGLWD
jgi:hypothetical protein